MARNCQSPVSYVRRRRLTFGFLGLLLRIPSRLDHKEIVMRLALPYFLTLSKPEMKKGHLITLATRLHL